MGSGRTSTGSGPVASEGRHVGLWRTARTLFAEEGLVTFWRGNTPAIALYGVYAAVQFSAFKAVMGVIQGLPAELGHSSQLFLAGGASGVCATMTAYPLDVM